MSEKDDIGGEPTAPSSAPQEIASPYSPTIGGLLQSCGPPPSKMFIIDTDDDEMEADSAQIEPQNDFSDCDARSHEDFDEEACDNCKNMELTARKAYESLTSYKKQIDKFTSFEKENQQLRNIYSENATYLEELLKTQKELESKNTQMEAELQYEKRQAESHEAQIKKAYSMLQENQAHLAAANEWRVKYDASQETLKQVHEMRKTYDEKMSDTLKVAQALQTQLGRAERKVEKLTDETNGVRARLKYISDYMPLLLSAVDLLLTRFPQEPEIRQRYTRLTEPDVRVVLMGKRITSKILEHAIAQGSTTWIQDVDNPESAEIEDSLDQDLRLSESEDDALETSFDTKSGFSQKLPARVSQPARTLQGTKIERKSPKKLFSKSNDAIESEDDAPETSFNTKSGFSQKWPARASQPARTLQGTKIERKSPKKLFSKSNDAIESADDAPETSFNTKSGFSQKWPARASQPARTLQGTKIERKSPKKLYSKSNDAIESADDAPETSFNTKSGFSQKWPARASQPARTLQGTKIERKSPKKLFSKSNDAIESEDDAPETSFNTKSGFSQKLPARALQPGRTLEGTKIERKSPKKLFSNADIILPNTSTVKLSVSNDAVETDETPSTIHERKTEIVRRQTGLPEAVKNNLIIRPRSIMTLHSPTTSRAIKRNTTFLKAQPLGTPISSKPKSETTRTSVAGLESSASSDDDELFDTISPSKISTNENVKNISSLEHAEGDPTDVHGVTSTIHGRKTRTVREQQQKMGNISDRIAKLKEDPTFAKATVETKEMPKDDKNNFTILPRIRRSATMAMNAPKSRKGASVSFESPPLDTQIVNKPENEGATGSFEGMASQVNDVSQQDNLDQDLRLSESEDEDIPDMPSGTKRVSFFVKPVEQRSPEKLSAPQDINTPKSPSEALSTEESNSTKTPETIKTTRERKARTPSGQPQITRNVSKRVVKPEEDAKATNQTKEVPKDVKQNVVTTSRPTRALRATTIATTTKTPRLVRKRNAACIDAQPLDAPITNKPKYMNTPESIASQIEDMFKKVADGVPLKKASGALAVDLDEAAKILDPPAIATLFIQVLNVTEVGNLWLSLTKSLNAYRKSNEANDLNDAFRHTTAKVELEFIQVINQMDLDGELFNETFNRVCTLIFCQKQPTITQFCRNVRVAFLLLHFNQVLSNEEKLIRSRKLVEFMLYERSADLALSSLCFLCFNEGHKLLDWLRGDDIDAVQRQICSLLANRSNKTQDYLDILSFIFPNVILSPLDTEVFLQSWINGLKALDEEIANKPTAFKLVDGKFEVDNNILNKIEQLIISLPSNTHTLQTLGIPDNLVKDSFAMIEQGIVGATNSTDGGLFSDSTKYNVEVDSKKLNLLCVHLLLAIDIIGEYVRSKTTPEIRRLMETLKHVDEKVPLLMSRCSQSKMSSECIALTKDILLNWQQSTKMLTEYQYME